MIGFDYSLLVGNRQAVASVGRFSDERPAHDLLTLAEPEADSGYFSPDYSVEAFRKFKPFADKDGFVKVVVVLKPSRTIALSNVKVKSYFGGEIESPEVRFRLDPPSEILARD